VLTQTEVEAGAVHEDDIAYGGHNLDDHLTDGRECDIRSYSVPPMYGIPYRCCYSRNIENLLIGGRLISASHIAHSSSRTMRAGGALGQGLGVENFPVECGIIPPVGSHGAQGSGRHDRIPFPNERDSSCFYQNSIFL